MQGSALCRRKLRDFLEGDHVEGPRRSVPWAPIALNRSIQQRREVAGDEALVEDPALVRDPRLGIPGEIARPEIRSIAVLGDSISHGVQGGVVARPQHAWPTLLGQLLDIEVQIAPARRFAPKFLETVLLVGHSRARHLLQLFAQARRELARRPADPPPDVLAVSGYDLDDAIDGPSERNGYTRDVLGEEKSPLTALQHRCGIQGPPDLLVIMLGANCVLRSIVTLDARWRNDDSEEDYEPTADDSDGFTQRMGTVWTPVRFQRRYKELAAQIAELAIPNVILTTVPHVSVAPLVRGMGLLPSADSESGEQPYFADYRWIFDCGLPSLRELSGETVQTIDQTIDVYNRIIRQVVVCRRRTGTADNWLLFDLCGVLDHIALRRNAGPGGRLREFPEELFGGLARDGIETESDPACKYLDSRFMLSGPAPEDAPLGDDKEGGLVSVDGVHPSAAGHLVLARALARTLSAGGITVPPNGAGAVDPVGLLRGDPLLRWFVEPGQAPLPTRSWLHWAQNLEAVVDDIPDALARYFDGGERVGDG